MCPEKEKVRKKKERRKKEKGWTKRIFFAFAFPTLRKTSGTCRGDLAIESKGMQSVSFLHSSSFGFLGAAPIHVPYIRRPF